MKQNTTALESLRDLEGVIGSFLIGEEGNVVAQDLPSYFGSVAYDMGPRAQRLREALQMTEGDVSLCFLRYGAHKISLRPVGPGLLTVVATEDVNLPALRMATTLVSKKLDPTAVPPPTGESIPPETVRPSAKTKAQAAPARTQGAPEAHGARPRRKRAVFFRGKRVE